jgi:hypothetical protein
MAEAHSILIDIEMHGIRLQKIPAEIQCGGNDQAIPWILTPHWFEGADPTATLCRLCNQPTENYIHDARLRDHQPKPESTDLSPALTAIRENLDPGAQALVDALIEGEGK